MGLSVEKARVKVQGSKLEQEGPLLITHWGLSGPAGAEAKRLGRPRTQPIELQF